MPSLWLLCRPSDAVSRPPSALFTPRPPMPSSATVRSLPLSTTSPSRALRRSLEPCRALTSP
ncbi:hypothetical protein DENSPDRAFT_886700 [Dentipellis sp. KUC8613]|nr:hypothetical protein DENSPDRAFT_886700 [Dentipellis sp. KUC8613]